MALMRTLRRRAGEAAIRTGHELLTFDQSSEKVVATFGNREGALVSEACGVLIGADGIRSRVRRLLHPLEGAPRFGEQVLWRGEADALPFFDGTTMIIAGHLHQRTIVYPIGRGLTPGSLRMNWICQIAVADDAPPEEWSRETSAEKVLASFADWRLPWLDVPSLVAATSRIYEFPLLDRDPVESWTDGRVTLIGDAAHPMYPIGGQAGSQAIIDARVLTAALVSETDPCTALRRYEQIRRPVMQDVTLRNRRFGPEAAMQLVEERAPNGFHQIEDVISHQELAGIAATFLDAAGLDVETVNERPSYVLNSTVATGL